MEPGRCNLATQPCLHCDSTGNGNCSACHGKGKILRDEPPGALGVLAHELSCSVCGGSGECQTCGGAGELEVGGEG